MNWAEKYRPKSITEVKGHRESLITLKNLVLKKEIALIYGPTGCGKTCSAHALANDLGLELIEMNASDFRNKDQIKQVIGNAIKQKSLFSKGKIILVDEVDGLSGREDAGGVSALVSLLDESSFPVILTAINPWDMKLNSLRKKTTLIEFKQLDTKEIVDLLFKICSKENVHCNEEELKILARRAGDARAAINDLQTLSSNNSKVTKEAIDILGEREREESVFNALRVLFKSKSPEQVLGVFDAVNVDLDEAMLWIDENLPLEYIGPDLVRAYDSLSKSDVFHGRILRRQYWRFLVYRQTLMTAGIALSKEKSLGGYVKYRKYGRILRYWIAKQKYSKRKEICSKIGSKIHCSRKRVIQDVFPYFRIINRKQKLDFGFTDEEKEWLNK